MKPALILLCLAAGLLASVARAADPEQQLEALKAKFPEMKTQVVEVTGRDTDLHSTAKVEVKVPPADVWAKYHGPIAAATLATLPGVLSRLETAKKIDSHLLQNHQKTLVGAQARAQALATANWLNGQLAGYLARLKALAPPPK